MSVGGWIFLVVAIGLAVWAVSVFNGLVARRNRFRNAFAQIDVQLKRRHDLIPNLVETAKGYMKHERDTLEAVIAARNAAANAATAARAQPGNAEAMQGLEKAEGQLTGVLGRLFAVAEAYPDLKANTNMIALQEELWLGVRLGGHAAAQATQAPVGTGRASSASSASAPAAAPPARANAAATASAPLRRAIAARTASRSRSGRRRRAGSRVPAPETSTRRATSI